MRTKRENLPLSPEVQKNEIDQDVLGVSFASDWLKLLQVSLTNHKEE